MLQRTQSEIQLRAQKVQAEKRIAERVKATFSGAVSKNNEFYCHCVIKDVSNTGMQLDVPKDATLPNEFDVKTPTVKEAFKVRQAWRRGTRMGVTYINMDEV